MISDISVKGMRDVLDLERVNWAVSEYRNKDGSATFAKGREQAYAFKWQEPYLYILCIKFPDDRVLMELHHGPPTLSEKVPGPEDNAPSLDEARQVTDLTSAGVVTPEAIMSALDLAGAGHRTELQEIPGLNTVDASALDMHTNEILDAAKELEPGSLASNPDFVRLSDLPAGLLPGSDRTQHPELPEDVSLIERADDREEEQR